MAAIFTISILQSALELGCMYALVALALFVSFSLLNIADLTTDGCFTLGCAVGAMVTLAGHPFLALAAALFSGVCAGFVTAFLQTRMGVESILAGIIVNTGLYTINIAVMGFSSIANLFNCTTIFSLAKEYIGTDWYKLIVAAGFVIVVGIILALFLGTRLGMSIRATGDNPDMVQASSINSAFTITAGLCIANSMTALSGALIAQYQKSCDINIGTGMVTIALASLIIGETIIGKGGMFRRVIGVIFGSCLYRFIVAVALRLSIPAECLKLVSAIIVAIAISFPYLKGKAAFWAKIKLNSKGGESK
ncbi:MAG: ABC transporter permease [Eubacterium sp.]|nr:ABC transporter permease [Eubacterium sp.]